MVNVAVVKASYTRQASAGKAAIRYIEHRPGKEGTKITRTLWSVDGKIERSEAYQLIDEAPKGSYLYRLVINPDPKTEDTKRDIYLRNVTDQTMRGLENHLGKPVQWLAATHDDHTPLRHVHILAVLPRKLDRNDLLAVRDMATEAAVNQRQERDSLLEQKKQREQGKEQRQWELHR